MNLFGWFKRSRSSAPVNASSPHKFRQIDDPGMGAAMSGSGGPMGGTLPGRAAALTGNFVRDAQCGVPGCHRDRDDPIHFPEG